MLNDDVLAREVASGFLIARVGWRFKNDAEIKNYNDSYGPRVKEYDDVFRLLNWCPGSTIRSGQ